jgi:hypothetical protein
MKQPKIKLNEWICTDPDMNQHGRKIGDKIYEFKQDMTYPDGSIVPEDETIDLNAYSNEQINNHLSTYSWTIESINKENNQEQADMLIAECIFEQLAQ